MGSFSSKESKLIIVGLDNSGKSTMIQRLKPYKQAQSEVAATVGYNIEKFKKNGINFTLMDMSGQSKYRDMWQEYCKTVDGVIFVIDSTDRLRFAMVQHELEELLEEPEIKNQQCPILFLANKMDVPGAATSQEFIDVLQLGSLGRPWQIFSSNAVTGDGIEQAFQWLTEQLKKTNN